MPKGFAHGFQTLTYDAEIAYQISAFYAPESAGGYRYDDPAFGIAWPLPVDRDQRPRPQLAAFRDVGVIPLVIVFTERGRLAIASPTARLGTASLPRGGKGTAALDDHNNAEPMRVVLGGEKGVRSTSRRLRTQRGLDKMPV